MRHLAVLAVPLALAGCAGSIEPTDGPTFALVSGTGQSLGTVNAWETPGGVTFRLNAAGLPGGIHGIHVHAIGRCDAPAFTTAGPHWNPAQRQHGFDNPAGPHQGDLPNVTVAATGVLQEAVTLPGATFAALRDADGSALVIHARADDLKTDPSGNSGDRIACAVLLGL
jgi:Cu-Zn family superoxide dismutase